MSVETHRVLMGTCGWSHAAWLNDFYSEDLPEDWQLGFYSNEFPVVYVPAADWVDVADLSEWTEDVSDSFRFVLEISTDVLENELLFITALEKAKTLDNFCLGLVLQLSPNLCNDSNLLEQRLSLAQPVALVCVDTKGFPVTDELVQFLSKHDIANVWHNKSNEKDYFQRGALAISRVSSDELDMASLRKVVEHCLSVSNENCVSVLCFDGEPPSLELLRNADIILNLL